MLFNSFQFLWFLLVVFALYWWLGGRRNGRQLQNGILLLASYFFYGSWNWGFLSLIVLSSVTD